MSHETTQGSMGRRWIALVVVCLAQLMITLDTTIVNVALPRIQDSLRMSSSGLIWIINGFLLTFGGLLLLAGRLGDLVGHRRVLIAGLAVFVVASLLCGIAPDPGVLIAARFLQGVGAAAQAAVVLAIIADQFPGEHERARAMSAYVFVAVSGGSLGLLLGGALTQSLSWRWIFLVNLPIGVLTVAGARIFVPRDPASWRLDGVDWLGSGLLTVAMMAVVFGVVQAGSRGWGSGQTLASLAVAVASAGALVLWERRVTNPILPIRILARRGLIASSVLRAGLSTAMFGTFFLGSLFAERVLHYGALGTGLAFIPWTASLGVLSLGVTTRLTARWGALPVMTAGLLLSVGGLLLLTRTTDRSSYVPLFAAGYVLIGVGAGSALSPMITVAIADVSPADRGLGSSITTVSQQVGGAIGLAVLSTLAAARTSTLRAAGDRPADALVGGYHLAYLVGAAVILALLLVSLPILHRHGASRQREMPGRQRPSQTPQPSEMS